jgi:hypothetical protein
MELDDPQARRGRRRAAALLGQFIGRIAERAEVVVVGRDGLRNLLDFVRAKRAIGNDGLSQIKFCDWRHLEFSLRVILRAGGERCHPAVTRFQPPP